MKEIREENYQVQAEQGNLLRDIVNWSGAAWSVDGLMSG